MLYSSRFPNTCWTYFNRSVRTTHQVIQQALKPIGSGRDGFEMVSWRFYDVVRLGETLPSGYNDVVSQISKNLTGNMDHTLFLHVANQRPPLLGEPGKFVVKTACNTNIPPISFAFLKQCTLVSSDFDIKTIKPIMHQECFRFEKLDNFEVSNGT